MEVQFSKALIPIYYIFDGKVGIVYNYVQWLKALSSILTIVYGN